MRTSQTMTTIIDLPGLQQVQAWAEGSKDSAKWSTNKTTTEDRTNAKEAAASNETERRAGQTDK